MLYSNFQRHINYLIVTTQALILYWAGSVNTLAFGKPTQFDFEQAIKNPEYVLDNWITLPFAKKSSYKKKQYLTLREAILLALRYNPNIQNATLDRIIQRYQLRLAENEFELQYALAGTATIEKISSSGAGNTSNHVLLATPELKLKTDMGTQLSLNLANNVTSYNGYSPVLNLSLTQPLLRGAGQSVNLTPLNAAADNEKLNKINLKQAVIDQVTQVISVYRALILSSNNLENQRRQLLEAKNSFEINEKKIAAGQLEPTGNIQQSYQIESLSLMVEQAENEFKTTALELLQSIGLDPATLLAVPTDIEVTDSPLPKLSKAIETALTHNSQYIAQQLALRASLRAYNLARNEQQWQLDLNANMQTGISSDVERNRSGGQQLYNRRNTTQSAGLQLTIPIHDLNRHSQMISAKVQLAKDKLNLMAAKRALTTTVTNTVNTIESQAKRYVLAKKQVKLALQSYDLEKKKQQAGIASALDVNNTQNQLIQAQSGLISAKIAYLNQLSALERLLGTTLDVWQLKLRYGQ